METLIIHISGASGSGKTTLGNKIKLALKLVNGILRNIKKQDINNLNEFVNIKRNDILNDENKKLLDEMSMELFEVFSKKPYYRKTKAIVLNCLRSIISETGYKLTRETITENGLMDNHPVRGAYQYYTIIE